MTDALWTIAPQDPRRIERLARELGLPPLVARLLDRRGIRTAAEAALFFAPGPEHLFDASRMAGVEEAADVLVATARAGRRIVVFGDYDVDGVTAVAQLRAALLRAGADAVAFLPHRLHDGYGLKPATVRRVLRDLRPALLITVDCGIGAIEGVACAREAGVDVVVTDHHLVPDALPQGAVVVNPRQPGCEYPFKDLAACGIAMKIAQAVARRAGVRLSLDSLLRVACLGTIADLVPLTGENRAIAAAGLARLSAPRAPGLRALLVESGVTDGRAPTAEEVAFRLAPRLNAAGRLDTAELALALLEERDPARGAEIARELSRRNVERQAIERRVTIEARERVGPDPEDRILVLGDSSWHRGVLGIAAARLAREYNRPVLLFALEGDRATGSGRSIPGVPLHETLTSIAHLFEEFGGHDQAVGATLALARFAEFSDSARALFRERVPIERLARTCDADADLPAEAVDDGLLRLLERFEPHGAGNPRPVFHAAGVRLSGEVRMLGEHGARGRIARSGAPLDFVCWDRATLRAGGGAASVDVRYHLQRDRFGRPEAELVALRSAG